MSEQNTEDLARNSYVRLRAATRPERAREERRRSNEGFHRTTFRESSRLCRQKVRVGNFFLQSQSETAGEAGPKKVFGGRRHVQTWLPLGNTGGNAHFGLFCR